MAVSVTVCVEGTELGAVYSPEAEIVPMFGCKDHVTPVLVVPWTVGVNCCVPVGPRVTAAGLSDTLICGLTVIVDVPVAEDCALLAAVTVTVTGAFTLDGAV